MASPASRRASLPAKARPSGLSSNRALLAPVLHLNTGTFTYEDIIDYDRSKNIGGSLNLSHSFGGPKGESQTDKTSQTMAGVRDAFKRSSFGVDGSYEKKDKEGITRVIVGSGTLQSAGNERLFRNSLTCCNTNHLISII